MIIFVNMLASEVIVLSAGAGQVLMSDAYLLQD